MRIERLLQKDPALYADMGACLRAGDWKTEQDSETALWLRYLDGPIHAIAAFDLRAAAAILSAIPPDELLVLRGCPGLRELAAEFGYNGCTPCWQAVYEKKTPVPVQTELTIRHPDAADYPKVAESYHIGDEDELRKDFARPDFLGGYLGGELVAYAGVHSEGSMGMLHVFPEFRRRGYAEAIYGTLINRQLEQGRVPYAQIIVGNEPSLCLQRKLGFTLSRDLLYWMWQEE